jgi:glycerol-3-phosphate dehydrogenase
MPVTPVRSDLLAQAQSGELWDFIIVGGGATGLGAALEAVSRGYRTLLLEAQDFAKATSSRSTKLVHGGVRYLQQGNLKLVLEALRERGRMLRNAPHLAHIRGFVIPAFSLFDLPFYGAGLTAYDLLAGRESIGRSRLLGKDTAVRALAGVRTGGIKGGILYFDGQFDDARYAIALLRTFLDLGGTALNYAAVDGLLKHNGKVSGVSATDQQSGRTFTASARVVINATGIFSDNVRRLDDPAVAPMLTVSQGTHFVLPRAWLPGNDALMIPKTSDGRVLFAIPWHDRVVVGTTDTPVPQPAYEPHSLEDERAFLAANIKQFFGRRPTSDDVRSMWTGQRPLVKPAGDANTAAISRDHTVLLSPSRLITVTGGKWTTYRKMGEDVVDQAIRACGLRVAPSVTSRLKLHGWSASAQSNSEAWDQVYGADLPELNRLASLGAGLSEPLVEGLPFRRAEVVWAVEQEMAQTVEDVLARRTRALFLDARASIAAAPLTARLMAECLGKTIEWQAQQVAAFQAVAQEYIWTG